MYHIQNVRDKLQTNQEIKFMKMNRKIKLCGHQNCR